MKRDLDLARQLLLDIENRGADCSVSVLRSGPKHDAEERIRYHLRLLVDGGLLKEVDRTSEGIPCLRLTNDGHELIELARSESRWREATWACQDRTGGLSLSVVRDILLRWASVSSRTGRPRRVYMARRPRYEAESYRVEPYRYIEGLEQRPVWDEELGQYVRGGPDVEEVGDRLGREGLDDDGGVDREYGPALPSYLV